MYQLRTIGEIHPYELVMGTLKDLKVRQALQDEIGQRIKGNFSKTPKLSTDKSFWDTLETEIAAELEGIWGNPILLAISRDVLLKRSLEFGRHIWEFEFAQIDSGRYKRVYHEGRSGIPICPYAESKGLQVIYLGRDNPFQLEALHKAQEGKEDDPELQRKRSEVWVTKIQPSPEIGQSLLIVGREHARNAFGLVDRLSHNGIQLVEIAGFDEYERNLDSKLRDEAATKSALSTGLDKTQLLLDFNKIIVEKL